MPTLSKNLFWRTCPTLSSDHNFGRAQPEQPEHIGLLVSGSRPEQVQLAQKGGAKFVFVPTISMSMSFLEETQQSHQQPEVQSRGRRQANSKR